jgi:hypothetical protein
MQDGNPLAFGTYTSSSGILGSAGNSLISGAGALSVIPEPTTVLLGGLGMLLLLRRRR